MRSTTRNQSLMPSQTVADNTSYPWSRYYGKPPYISDDMLSSEYRKQTSAPDLPVAYIGKSNYYIPDLIEELVMTTDNWYTTVAAPIRFTNDITYQFNKTTYDARLPRNTPHKGTSRILEYKKQQQGGRLHRIGMAYEMEADFMDTPEGQEHYAFTLNQLANSIIMDINIGVMAAYFNANAYRRRLEEVNGMRISTDVMDKMQREIRMFAIIQKSKNGLKKLAALAEEQIGTWQGQSNMWIFPPKVKQWSELVPPENTDYWLSGYRNPIDTTDATKPMGSLNGKPVYLCRMQEDAGLEFGGKRNMLARQREIGSYYTMMATNRRNCSNDFYLHHYKTAVSTIKVYDEDNDDWAWLNMREAHDNCHVYDKDGNVEMPRHDNHWANLADRSRDMLSYDDNDGHRKPVRLFGHLSRNHFSTKSQLDFARTFAGYVKRTDGDHMDFGCVESALKAGRELFTKISTTRMTTNWFYNVLMERFARGSRGNTAIALSNAGAMTSAEWKSILESMTTLTKRTSKPMRMIDGCYLPSVDYYSYVSSENEDGARTAQSIKKPGAAGVRLGGNSGVGVLAGFGNWDGFLALQAELNSGVGSATGYTSHGYLQSDCEIADRTVKAIRALAKSLQFVFKNQFFLQADRAFDHVENPTVEHVLFENLLGFGGIPLWLDATSVASLTGRDAGPVNVRGTGGGNSFERVMQEARAESNVTLALADAMLSDFSKRKSGTKISDSVPRIRRKLALLFGPFDNSAAGSALNVYVPAGYASEAIDLPMFKFLRVFFPYACFSPVAVSYESLAERRTLVDAMAKLIMDNPGLNDAIKVKALGLFLDSILGALGLVGVFENIDATGQKALTDLLGVGMDGDVGDIKAWFKGVGLDDYDYTRFSPKMTAEEAALAGLSAITDPSTASAITKGVSGHIDVSQYYSDAVVSIREAVDTDARNLQTKPDVLPIIHMLGLAGTDIATELPRLQRPEASSKYVSIGPRFGSVEGDDPAAEMADREASLKKAEAVAGGGKFYRSSLTVSASQVAELAGIVQTTRLASGPKQGVMGMRMSDPYNPAEAFVEPGRMPAVVKKIEDLNDGAGGDDHHASTTAMHSEPYYMFYPDKAAVRDVTLASMVGKLESAKKYGTPRGRRSTGADAEPVARGYKRSRGLDTEHGVGRSHKKRVMVRDYDSDSDDDYGKYDYGTVASRSDSGEMGGLAAFVSGGKKGSGGSGSSRHHRDSGEGTADDDMDDIYDAVDVTSFRRTMGINSGNDLLTAELMASMVALGGATDSLYLKIVGKVFLTSNFNKHTMNKFLDNDMLLPAGFIVLQPHKRYVAYAAILLQGGESTAVTLVGHSGLAMQNDASTKTHFGHFTTYDATVVKNDNNVLPVYDIFLDGTLGGAGVRPIHPHHYAPHEGKTGGGSLIYIMVPYEEDVGSNIIDASGRFDAANEGNFVDQKRMNLPTYSQNWRANLKWRFKSIDAPFDVEPPPEGNAPGTNFVVVRGQQHNYSTVTHDYTDLVTAKGHLGDEGPGSKTGRQGGLEMFVKRKTINIS